jgi:tetratricopeptide (TPR) repeat protein
MTLTWPNTTRDVLDDIEGHHQHWIAQGRWPEWEHLLVAAVLLPDAQEPIIRARLLLKLAITHRLRGNHSVAARLFEGLTQVMEAPETPRILWAEWQYEWAYLLHRMGHTEQAILLLEGSLEVARGEAEPIILVKVLERMAGIYAMRGDHDRALAMLDEADQYEAPAYLKGLVAMTRVYVSNVQGKWSEALEKMRALEPTTHGHAFFRIIFLNNLAALLTACGHYDEAHAALLETLGRAERVGDQRTQALAMGNLVILSLEAGRLHAGAQYAPRAIAANAELGDDLAVATLHCNLGQILSGLGSRSLAWQHLKEAETRARAGGYAMVLAYTMLACAELALREESWAEARTYAEEARELFANQQDASHHERSIVRLIQANLGVGRLPEADELLRELVMPSPTPDRALLQALAAAQIAHKRLGSPTAERLQGLEHTIATGQNPAILAEGVCYLLTCAAAKEDGDACNRLWLLAAERLTGQSDATIIARGHVEAMYNQVRPQ